MEPLGGMRELTRADFRHTGVNGKLRELRELRRRQAPNQQVEVVEPDQTVRVAVMHDRMDAGQEQCMHATDGARVRSERHDGDGVSSELIVRQNVGEERLRADLPVNIEDMLEAEAIASRHLELAEHQFAAGHRRFNVPQRCEDTTDDLHLVASDQEVGVGVGPQRRRVIGGVCERGSLEEDRSDVADSQCGEGSFNLTSPNDLARGG